MRPEKQIILIAFILTGIFACTSERKVSRVDLPQPPITAPPVAVTPAVISSIRIKASEPLNRSGCTAAFLKHLRSVAMQKWLRRGCPTSFAGITARVIEAGNISSAERVMLESLQQMDCKGQGLISSVEGNDSLAENLRIYLSKSTEPTAIARDIAQEHGQSDLRALLEQIFKINVAIERKIATQGDYLLTDKNLEFVMNLVDDNCKLRASHQYFTRDTSVLADLEQNETLIHDAKLRTEYVEFRRGLQQIFDKSIKSFF